MIDSCTAEERSSVMNYVLGPNDYDLITNYSAVTDTGIVSCVGCICGSPGIILTSSLNRKVGRAKNSSYIGWSLRPLMVKFARSLPEQVEVS